MPTQEDVDVILLRSDESPPPDRVLQAIQTQAGVRARVHRLVGRARADDPNRWATIARVRNQGRRLGSARWVMYIDDDVVLGKDCVARLLGGLRQWPSYAALAADYLGEVRPKAQGPQLSRHVAMGATLFRREILAFLNFRWEARKCECQCCCDDLRRAGFGIGYLPEAEATHDGADDKLLPSTDSVPCCKGTASLVGDAAVPKTAVQNKLAGRVLTSFDRRHWPRFRGMFLSSLRQSGNLEPVTAVAYGLAPSQGRALAALPGVEVVSLPMNDVATPIRRLHDFQAAVSRLPEDTPVAYWDAGDVLFQGRLGPLWDLVRAYPNALLAVREPTGHPENWAVSLWTRTIQDPEARRYAYDLLTRNPFLNAGFAAGTVRAMLRYLRAADRLQNSSALHGTADWGDQTALNLYCHSNPECWREVGDEWNYCIYTRPANHYRMAVGGRVESRSGAPIHVVHGNAKTLRKLDLSFLT